MLLHTKHGHLKFTDDRGRELLCPRRGRASRSPRDFRDECVRAAREIAESFRDQKLVLFMSGGLDSEIVARSLRRAGVNFEVLIVRLNSDLNLHDISWAVDYCEENDLQYSIYDFDIHKSFRNGQTAAIQAIGRETLFPSYAMIAEVLHDLLFRKKKNFVPIIGAGEPEFVWIKSKIFYYEYQSDFSTFRYMHDNQISGVPLFFEWSPELHLSFICSREIQNFIYTGPANFVTSEPIKTELYRAQFDIQSRPKYNGFERASAYFPTLVPNIPSNLTSEINLIEYGNLMSQLSTPALQKESK